MNVFPAGIRRLAVCTVLGLAMLTPYAWAQAPSLGASTAIAAQYGVNSATAYDDKHDVYLHVYEASRKTMGRFISANGTVLGSAFEIGTWRQTYALQPKVAYSRDDPDKDVFLVLYVSDKNKYDKGANIFGQRVRYTGSGSTAGTLVGEKILISPNSGLGSTVQKPSDVVYNPVTHRFLTVYESGPTPDYEVMVRQFDTEGVAVAAEVNVSAGPGGQGGARAAHDWESNRYFVVYMGDNPLNAAQIGIFARTLNGGTAAPLSSTTVLDLGFRMEVAATFLPEKNGFLASWMKPASSTDRNVVARFVPSSHTSGAPAEAAYAVMATPGINEGAATMDYDYISRRVLVSGMRDPKNIAGALLDGNGSAVTGVFPLGTPVATSGSFNPFTRVAEAGRVAVSFVTDYLLAQFERYQLTPASTPGPSCCGEPEEELPPDPPGGGGGGGGGGGAGGDILIHTDNPLVGQQVQPPFILRGWAIDKDSTSGPGVNAIQVWAVSQSSSAQYNLGWVPVGVENRTEVASAHGSNFLASGFNAKVAHIPPGGYTLVLFAFSTVTNTTEYDKPHYVPVTVAGGVITKVTTPAWGQVFGNHGIGMTVSGWAVDMSKPTGTGVDQVYVYAVKASTGTASLLGGASYGQVRPEVGVQLGDFRFNPSGFTLTNTVSLSSGLYYILVFSHSVGAAQFNVHVATAAVIQ